MVSICKDCGQGFLSPSEYKRHLQTHLQTHIDRWSSNSKPDKLSWKSPEGMNQDLFKIFEKYRLGERAMLCLWVNGQLNTAIRESSRIFELRDTLKEWLQELRWQGAIVYWADTNTVRNIEKCLLGGDKNRGIIPLFDSWNIVGSLDIFQL